CDALLAGDGDGDGDGDGNGNGGNGSGDSQAVLEELERANLFLVPLDDERVWYRYHHLFADALRGRLAREAGAGAGGGPPRAGGGGGGAGGGGRALARALPAPAPEHAATWIEALPPRLFATMSIHQPLAAWLAALPAE